MPLADDFDLGGKIEGLDYMLDDCYQAESFLGDGCLANEKTITVDDPMGILLSQSNSADEEVITGYSDDDGNAGSDDDGGDGDDDNEDDEVQRLLRSVNRLVRLSY